MRASRKDGDIETCSHPASLGPECAGAGVGGCEAPLVGCGGRVSGEEPRGRDGPLVGLNIIPPRWIVLAAALKNEQGIAVRGDGQLVERHAVFVNNSQIGVYRGIHDCQNGVTECRPRVGRRQIMGGHACFTIIGGLGNQPLSTVGLRTILGFHHQMGSGQRIPCRAG